MVPQKEKRNVEMVEMGQLPKVGKEAMIAEPMFQL